MMAKKVNLNILVVEWLFSPSVGSLGFRGQAWIPPLFFFIFILSGMDSIFIFILIFILSGMDPMWRALMSSIKTTRLR